MPLRDDDTIREKIGSMQSDVRHVSNQVEKVANKLDEANDNIINLRTSTVKQAECTQRTQFIADKLDQLKEEIAKKQTRPDNPAIGYGSGSGIFPTPAAPTEFKKPRKSLIVKMKDNLGVILAIITVSGLLIAGVVKFAYVIVTIDKTLKINEKKEEKNVDKLRAEIEKLRKDQKKVIYIPVYKRQDSGPSEQPRRRRRRRPR